MHIFEIDRLEQIVGKDRVRKEEPLAKHTTFRIGGPAKWFVEPDSAEQLAACIKYLEEVQMQWYILGNGSNLLVADEGYDGVILSLHRMNKEAGQVGELHQIRILPADASETEKVAVLEEYGVKQCISTVKAYVSAGCGSDAFNTCSPDCRSRTCRIRICRRYSGNARRRSDDECRCIWWRDQGRDRSC